MTDIVYIVTNILLREELNNKKYINQKRHKNLEKMYENQRKSNVKYFIIILKIIYIK